MKNSKHDLWGELTGLDGRNGMEAKQILQTLKKAEPEEAYHLLVKLTPMVMQEYQSCTLTAEVFSALTDLLPEVGIDKKITILSFLCTLKPVLSGFDKASLNEESYYHYFDSLERLQSFCSRLLAPEELNRLNPSDRSEFAVMYLTVMLHSFEPAAFFIYRPFQNAFHVTCPHCGNDIHSLYVNPEEPEQSSTIVPADLPEYEPEEILLPEDTYRWLYRYLSEAEEPYYIKYLPWFYGNHVCGKCGRPYEVMEGLTRYIRDFYLPMPTPEKGEIEKLLNHAHENQMKGNYEKAVFYHRYALFLQNQPTNEGHVETARIELLLSTNYGFMQEYRYQKLFAKKAMAVLEELEDYPLDLAEACRIAGVAYTRSFEKEGLEEDLVLAGESYKKAKEIFDRELGTGNSKSMLVNHNLALMMAEQQKDALGGIRLLEENIRLEEGKADPDWENIADIHKTISDIYMDELEDYKKSIYHYQPYLDFICKEYGNDSDMAADSYRELAQRYEQLGEIDTAAGYYEKTLEINIDEMGRVYLLPSIFKRTAIGVLKLFNKNKADQDVMQRSMSAAESFDDVGFLYLESRKYKKAMKSFKKALALREWVFHHPTKEFGDSYANMASVYEAQGNIEKAVLAYKKAVSVYRSVISYDYQDGRPIFISEAEECEEMIEEVAGKLEAMGVVLEDLFEVDFDEEWEEEDDEDFDEDGME